MQAEVEVVKEAKLGSNDQHGLTSCFCLVTSRKMNRKLDVL